MNKDLEKALRFEISADLIRTRIYKGFTQKQLADRLETQQPFIARLESGKHLPSMETLRNLANVYECDLLPPRFGFMKDIEDAKDKE